MKLKKHQLQITMPDYYQVLSVIILDAMKLNYVLQQVSPSMMATLTKNPETAMPRQFCVEEHEVMLYPRPDKDYECRVEYLPPPKVL